MVADFGFHIQHNYFETSHAKGEQDAAGSHVKQKVSQAEEDRHALPYLFLPSFMLQPTPTENQLPKTSSSFSS